MYRENEFGVCACSSSSSSSTGSILFFIGIIEKDTECLGMGVPGYSSSSLFGNG